MGWGSWERGGGGKQAKVREGKYMFYPATTVIAKHPTWPSRKVSYAEKECQELNSRTPMPVVLVMCLTVVPLDQWGLMEG